MENMWGDLNVREKSMHARGTDSITRGVNAAHDKGHTALPNHVVMLMHRLKNGQNVAGGHTGRSSLT